jgi:ElaA protein
MATTRTPFTWPRGPQGPKRFRSRTRVLPPDRKYPEASIGRVLTSGSARGTGLGRDLVQRAIRHCAQAFPGRDVRISAQSHLERFYAEAGFVAAGPPCLEDGIPHTEMLRPFG